MLRLNPFASIGLGVVLIAISFAVPGTTRDLILRIVGAVAILVGAVSFLARRR